MKITQAHRDYWIQKRGSAFLKQADALSIDTLIPGDRTELHLEAGNTLVLLKSKIRRGLSLRESLLELASGNHHRPRRNAFAKKWLRKLL